MASHSYITICDVPMELYIAVCDALPKEYRYIAEYVLLRSFMLLKWYSIINLTDTGSKAYWTVNCGLFPFFKQVGTRNLPTSTSVCPNTFRKAGEKCHFLHLS